MSAAISLIDDVEEVTEVNLEVGALPEQPMCEETGRMAAPHCSSCGRPMGPVAVPGVSLFDLGVKHALNRLTQLIAAIPGMTAGEARAIVLRLQERDVEL